MNNNERSLIHRFFNTQRTAVAQLERPFSDRCVTKTVRENFCVYSVHAMTKSNVLYIYDTPVAAVFPGRLVGNSKEGAKDVVVVSEFFASRQYRSPKYFSSLTLAADCREVVRSVPEREYEIITVLGPIPEPNYKHSPYRRDLEPTKRRQDLITYFGQIMKAHADMVLNYANDVFDVMRGKSRSYSSKMTRKEWSRTADRFMQSFEKAKLAFGYKPKRLYDYIEKSRAKCAAVVDTAMAQLKKDNPELFTTEMKYVASSWEEYDERRNMENMLMRSPMYYDIQQPTTDQFGRSYCVEERHAQSVRLSYDLWDDLPDGNRTHAEYLVKVADPIVTKYMSKSLLKVKRYGTNQLEYNIFPIDLNDPAETVVACVCLCQPHETCRRVRMRGDGTDSAKVVVSKDVDEDGNATYYTERITTGRGATISGERALRAAAVLGKLYLTDPKKIVTSFHLGCFTVYPYNSHGDQALHIGCHSFNRDTVQQVVHDLCLDSDGLKTLYEQHELERSYKAQARIMEPDEIKELEGYEDALKEVREKLAEVENGPNSYANLRREYKRKCLNDLKERVRVIMDYDDEHMVEHSAELLLQLRQVNDAIAELEEK